MNRASQVLVGVAAVIIASASVADAGWVISDADGQETVISKGKMKSGWENGAMIIDAEKDEAAYSAFLEKYIYGVSDFAGYLALCGGAKRMEELRALERE